MDISGVTSILVLLLFTVNVTAQSEDIEVEECATQCTYDETAGEYVMNCTQRQCTNTPKFHLSSLTWSSYVPNMMTLNLKENHIRNVTVFDKLTSLTRIDLTHSQIETITPSAFAPCYALTTLILADNLLTTVSATDFNGLSVLEVLDLSGNKINNIEDQSFSQLKHLTSLFLRNNQLVTMQPNVFEELRKLEYLYLDNNQLVTLDGTTFDQLSQLKELHLQNNALTSVPLGTAPKYFTLLSLDGNKIKEIPNGALPRMHNLVVLRLQDNGLETLGNAALNDLISLRFLHLQDNLLTEFDLGMGLHNLTLLDLQRNRLTQIQKSAFFFGDKLEFLDLEGNAITSISTGAFSGIGNLRALNLKNNRITWLPLGTVSYLNSLEHLMLEDNPIHDIAAGALPKSLEKFSLKRSTKLERINNGTFTGLKRLKQVEIMQNKHLVTIEPGAFDGEKSTVLYLDLYDNALQSIDEHLVNWSQIEVWNLAKNNWNCDCEMAWVKHTEHISDVVKDTMICHSPYHLKGKHVSSVAYETFSCAYYDTHRGGIEAGLIALVSALFLGLAVLLCYKFRHTVFQCCYTTPGKYTSMTYDAVNTNDDDAVRLNKEREQVLPGPTSV